MHFTFTSVLENFNTKLWQYHLPVPEEVAEKLIIGKNKRVKCRLNERLEIKAALMKTKAYWFILVNKQVKSQLHLVQGEKVNVALEKDQSEYGHEMPEEFEALLDQDEQGSKHFHSLTLGKQRSLIYLVGKVKNSQSRINKALAIIEHLKERGFGLQVVK